MLFNCPYFYYNRANYELWNRVCPLKPSCTDNGLTSQCSVSLNECLLRDACCCQTVYWWAVGEQVSGISVVTRWLRPLVPVCQEFNRCEHVQLEPELTNNSRERPSKTGTFRLIRFPLVVCKRSDILLLSFVWRCANKRNHFSIVSENRHGGDDDMGAAHGHVIESKLRIEGLIRRSHTLSLQVCLRTWHQVYSFPNNWKSRRIESFVSSYESWSFFFFFFTCHWDAPEILECQV